MSTAEPQDAQIRSYSNLVPLFSGFQVHLEDNHSINIVVWKQLLRKGPRVPDDGGQYPVALTESQL